AHADRLTPLARLPPQQSHLSRHRAWSFAHSCPGCVRRLPKLDEGLLARWGNSYHPSLFAEFEGDDMKIDGRCHCGYVRFEAEAETPPICNYTACQPMRGPPLRAIVAPRPGTFVLLSRKPTEYRKTADSGNVRVQAFCPHCGTPIYATSTGDEPKAYNVRLGSLRQRNEFVPRRQIFVRSQQAWVHDLNSIPKFDGPPR